MKLRFATAISALVLAVAFAFTTSNTTTIVPATPEELTTKSTDVVEARAIDSRSAWDPEHTMIYTYTRFEIRKTLKGTAPNVITVKQMGGHAEGYTQRVSGVRYWQPGDEAVLFLRPSVSNDNTMVITGLVQGAYAMSRLPSGEVTVSNGVRNVTTFSSENAKVEAFRGSRMTLQQMENRVRKAVEQ